MTAIAAPKSTLRAALARDYVLAEVDVAKLEAELEVAKERRDDLRKRVKPKLVPSAEKDDAGKDVLVGEAGGFRIRVSTFTGGDSFSLAKYLKAGHKITAAMRDALTPGSARERWTWKDVRGPRRPDAVEPK